MSTIEIYLKEYKNQEIIDISGSKNSSLPIIASSILCDEIVYLHNIPNINDVNNMLEILNFLNIKFIFKNNSLIIYPKKFHKWNLDTDITNKLRGSYYFLGSLISKKSKAQISNIGGCNLGSRPINYHLNSFNKLGLSIENLNKSIKIKGKIKSTEIDLDYPSMGASINIILASVKNKRKTKVIINNCAMEPEVTDLCNFLNSMGAKISGINTPTLVIESVKYLYSTNYTVISDRIEAGTFLILGALHNGIKLKNVNTEHLESILIQLKKIGCIIETKDNILTLIPNKSKSICIETKPYPGFPTDLAPQMSVLASQLNGFSTISETVYKERFSHISELKKLNINIIRDLNISYIDGKQKIIYNDSKLNCKDLRQGAALILASSLSKTKVSLTNTSYIERGYEDIYNKLSKLGFVIKKKE